jgi:hypothetical protein
MDATGSAVVMSAATTMIEIDWWRRKKSSAGPVVRPALRGDAVVRFMLAP